MTEWTQLLPFTVTVRCFDPTDPLGEDGPGAVYDLPVDSPDAQHAVAAAMSNAVAFTTEVAADGTVVPVAFQAVAVRPR